MFRSTLSAFAILGAALASPRPEPAAAGGAVCSQKPYVLIQPFKSYPPAQSFCSAKYPVKPSTTTTTTTPVTTTTETDTNTITASEVTTTTVTTTVTTAPNGATEKRAIKRSNTQSSKWKACTSSLSKLGNVFSTACSCIETPVTNTVTSTAPTSTATATTTTDTTITNTVTSTETSTTAVPAPTCPAGSSNVCCDNYFSGLCAGGYLANQDANGVYHCGSGTYVCCNNCTPDFGSCVSCTGPS